MNLIFKALKYNFIQTSVNLCVISSFCITVKSILWFLPHKLQPWGCESLGAAFALSSLLVSQARHVTYFFFLNHIYLLKFAILVIVLNLKMCFEREWSVRLKMFSWLVWIDLYFNVNLAWILMVKFQWWCQCYVVYSDCQLMWIYNNVNIDAAKIKKYCIRNVDFLINILYSYCI